MSIAAWERRKGMYVWKDFTLVFSRSDKTWRILHHGNPIHEAKDLLAAMDYCEKVHLGTEE